MSLIVQDGTGLVDGAYAYASETVICAYAAARGVTITEEAATVHGIKAMDYIEIQDFKGYRTNGHLQSTEFPRERVSVGGCILPADAIPQGLIDAHCEASMLISQGVDLQPNTAAEQSVKREKIGGTNGAIETEYFAEAPYSPTTPRLDALLRPFVNVGFTLRSYRA